MSQVSDGLTGKSGGIDEIFANWLAPGLLEKRENGKWYGGYGNHWSDELLGGINGRNDARKATNDANKALTQDIENQRLNALDDLARKELEDRQASSTSQGLLKGGKKPVSASDISDPATLTSDRSGRKITPLGKSDLATDFLGI